MQEVIIKKYQPQTLLKVLERLIKNEKFHCKIMVSMLLLLIKQHSSDGAIKD